ncbi:MAG: hypothetical protein RL701_3946, partial [Pseudomonadota bacterium]
MWPLRVARVSVYYTTCFVLLALSAAACGDDDDNSTGGGGSSGSKAGSSASSGKGGTAGGNVGMIPRPDAGVDTPEAVPACNPTIANSCKTGYTCDLLIRRKAADTDYSVMHGCVAVTRERGLGDPCDPVLPNAAPYEAPGVIDEIFREPCGSGLSCAPNRAVRGAYSCQTACGLGRYGTTPIQCAKPDEICFPASQVADACRKPDACDVSKQSGCLGEEACFLMISNDRRQYLTFCTEPLAMPDPDGATGCTLLSCTPGSVCSGPVNVPFASWTDENVKCRRSCDGSKSGGSAGAAAVEDDAGVPAGACSAATQCEPFAESS